MRARLPDSWFLATDRRAAAARGASAFEDRASGTVRCFARALTADASPG